MGWSMDSHGNWTNSSGSGSTNSGSGGGQTNKTAIDKGNTSDTDESIADTTSNKTAKLKYAEEARFETDGDFNIRRGGYLNVGGGVAGRWQGSWLILESTHTVTPRGYVTEGLVARIPYYEETNDNSSNNSSSDSGSDNSGGSSNSGNSGGSSGGSGGGSSGGKWVMDPDGTWHKK